MLLPILKISLHPNDTTILQYMSITNHTVTNCNCGRLIDTLTYLPFVYNRLSLSFRNFISSINVFIGSPVIVLATIYVLLGLLIYLYLYVYAWA